MTAFDDHNGLQILIAAAGGNLIWCDWSPNGVDILSRDGPLPPCPDPAAPVHGADSVVCDAIGQGSVIAGQISPQVAVLRVTFPDGSTTVARLAGGCFAVIDPAGAAIADLIHQRNVRIQATNVAGAILYDGPF